MKRYHVMYVVRPILQPEFGTEPHHLGWYRWRWLARQRALHFNSTMRLTREGGALATAFVEEDGELVRTHRLPFWYSYLTIPNPDWPWRFNQRFDRTGAYVAFTTPRRQLILGVTWKPGR